MPKLDDGQYKMMQKAREAMTEMLKLYIKDIELNSANQIKEKSLLMK